MNYIWKSFVYTLLFNWIIYIYILYMYIYYGRRTWYKTCTFYLNKFLLRIFHCIWFKGIEFHSIVILTIWIWLIKIRVVCFFNLIYRYILNIYWKIYTLHITIICVIMHQCMYNIVYKYNIALIRMNKNYSAFWLTPLGKMFIFCLDDKLKTCMKRINILKT